LLQLLGELEAGEFLLVLLHQDAHHLVEGGIHQAARFDRGWVGGAFEEEMEAVTA